MPRQLAFTSLNSSTLSRKNGCSAGTCWNRIFHLALLGFAAVSCAFTLCACHAAHSDSSCLASFSAAGGFDSLWRPNGDPASGRISKVTALKPGQNLVVGEIQGPAVIRRIWMTSQSPIPQIHGLMVLRIWWDDETSPSVEAPLGDFFGTGFGQERELKSLMAESFPASGENHAALVCYWPMPFARKARIAIENRGARNITMFFIHADYQKFQSLPSDSLYFHAQWRRENPVRLHVPYTILEARGRGCYAGTVLNYHLLGPGAWVEGGDDFFIDGDEKPTLPGTGAEDYFGQAWGFRKENNALTHGTSLGPEDSQMTAYRWHIFDPVWFRDSIKVQMRCHGWDVQDRQDDYSSVAYWYQTEPHAAFPPLPPPDYDYLGVEPKWRETVQEAFSTSRLPSPPPGENLTREAKSWRASGQYDNNSDGGQALDGDLATKWCEAAHPGEQWLALDFGRERMISGFILKSASCMGETEGFDTNAFRVEAAQSLDGPWKTLVSIDNEKAPPNPEFHKAVDIVHFKQSAAARCVRLFITNPGALDSIARIPEFEVYGE